MAGIAGHSARSRETVLVESVHHQHHPARSPLHRGVGAKLFPACRAVRGMVVRAVHACGGSKHAHGVDEFVNGNPFENLDVLKTFFRHLRFLFLPSLTVCGSCPPQAQDCYSSQTELHVVSLRLVRVRPTMAVPFSARCLLFFAAAIQDTRHSVISLVTGVLENPTLALPPGNCGRPGFRPGCWILECDFVIDRVGIETREALDMVIPGALQIRMTLGCSCRLPGL